MSEFIDDLLDSDSIILIIPATYAVCYLIVAFIRKKIRTINLRNAAIRLGMKFSKIVNRDVTTEHQIPDFDKNFIAKLRNLLVGKSQDFSLIIYDQTDLRRRKPAITRTFARVDLRTFDLPYFHLTPNSWVEKIFHKWGDGQINFDEDITFSKAYRLQGDNSLRLFTKEDFDELRKFKEAKNPNEQKILRTHDEYEGDLNYLFQQELRTLCSKRGNWHIKSEGGYLYFNWSNKRIAPRQYPEFIDGINEIVRHLKQVLQKKMTHQIPASR